MAGPVADKILLPSDTGNTGKKVRTQTRVVGSDTVHEHYFVQISPKSILGVYRAMTAQLAIGASAQNGTTTGFLWFSVPTSITNKKVRIRRALFSSQHATAFAGVSAPRIVAQPYTFTGTASGASITQQKIDSSMPTSIADLRTANTGMTITLLNKIAHAPIVGALTAVGGWAPSEFNMIDVSTDEDAWPVIAPGEGIAFWQDVAGTASETRVGQLQLLWDEIDVA